MNKIKFVLMLFKTQIKLSRLHYNLYKSDAKLCSKDYIKYLISKRKR